MQYDVFIQAISNRLVDILATSADHNLDEKYIASATRDYCEAIRALEQAKNYKRKEVTV